MVPIKTPGTKSSRKFGENVEGANGNKELVAFIIRATDLCSSARSKLSGRWHASVLLSEAE
jgi:hypothetical protein